MVMEDNIIKYEDITLKNMYPQISTISVLRDKEGKLTLDEDTVILLDFGKKNIGDLVETMILFDSDKHKITDTSASCGCTSPRFQNTEDGKQVVTIKFDSNKITQNVSKAFTLYLDNKASRKIKFNLVINKS